MSTNPRDELIKDIYSFGDHKIGRELMCTINARYKLLYLVTNEEQRLLNLITNISKAESYELYTWDLYKGMIDSDGNQVEGKNNSNEIHKLPEAALGFVLEAAVENAQLLQKKAASTTHQGKIFVFFDIHHFMRDNGSPRIERILKKISEIESKFCVIIVSHSFICPQGLRTDFTLMDIPYPSREELEDSINEFTAHLPAKLVDVKKFVESNKDELIDSVTGLTLEEAENACAKSVVKTREMNIPVILEEKKQIVSKNHILEYREPRYTFDDIGGLGVLKQWLTVRKNAFSKEARSYGLDTPKGILIVGIPGCGKSLTCEALGSFYKYPLLRLDLGAVFSSLVGDSERNMRTVLRTAEALSPLVLWVDEIEKGIGGVKSSNLSDSGVTNRVFGTLLTWLQDKTKPVFVVCTANSIADIPPEFQRAGRFDEIFFIDLPDYGQRIEVISCLLKRRKQEISNFNLDEIAFACENYSPAEIEKGINNGLFVSFSEQSRQLTTQDITSELKKFKPLFDSRKEEIEAMRTWAIDEGRAVLANPYSSTKLPQNTKKILNL